MKEIKFKFQKNTIGILIKSFNVIYVEIKNINFFENNTIFINDGKLQNSIERLDSLIYYFTEIKKEWLIINDNYSIKELSHIEIPEWVYTPEVGYKCNNINLNCSDAIGKYGCSGISIETCIHRKDK